MKKEYNIKTFFKENYFTIIFLILFSIFCFYDTGYSIYKPGGTINASERVSGTNINKGKGTFNMAYVGMMKGKLPFYLLAKVIPSWELVKNEKFVINENENIEDVYARDNLDYKGALSNALYVAFTKANIPFKETKNNYYVYYKTKENDSNLKVGDEIISYDNIPFESFNELVKYINTKKENDQITIKYKEGKNELESKSTIYKKEDRLYIGLSIINIKEIESDYNISVKTKGSESGPSGGLITTLAIYNALTKEDITHGKKIVGTGTIALDGTVGEIGAVNYKIDAAEHKHADIFLCPKENYQDAVEYAKKKKYDIIIVEVGTIDDALNYLNSLEG